MSTFKKPSKTSTKQQKACKNAAQSQKGFQMPPMSITKIPPKEHQLQILKKRQYSDKEDLKRIKETLQNLKDKKVTLEEFVTLISPFTSDSGAVLIRVMADEIAYFRKMVKKVYDTMTQDMTDVLTNEQIQMHEFYTDKINVNTDRASKALNEIFSYIPDFNREEFLDNEDEYLRAKFPLPIEEGMDPESAAVIERQHAYHRLQWLRSEGTRLHDENVKLNKKLREARKMQKVEMCKARTLEKAAEVKQVKLEAEQTKIEDELVELNDSIDEALVRNEKQLRLHESLRVHDELSGNKKGKKGKTGSVCKDVEWGPESAKEIELRQTESTLFTDISAVTMRSNSVQQKQDVLSGIKSPSTAKNDSLRIERPDSCSPRHYSPQRCSPSRAAPMDPRMESSLCVPRGKEITPPPVQSNRQGRGAKENYCRDLRQKYIATCLPREYSSASSGKGSCPDSGKSSQSEVTGESDMSVCAEEDFNPMHNSSFTASYPNTVEVPARDSSSSFTIERRSSFTAPCPPEQMFSRKPATAPGKQSRATKQVTTYQRITAPPCDKRQRRYIPPPADHPECFPGGR